MFMKFVYLKLFPNVISSRENIRSGIIAGENWLSVSAVMTVSVIFFAVFDVIPVMCQSPFVLVRTRVLSYSYTL